MAAMGLQLSSSSTSETEYLCVDRYLTRFVDVQALSAALELGLVEALANGECLSLRQILDRIVCESLGMELLLDLLCASEVLERPEPPALGFRLTAGFIHAFEFRDLIEAKIDFANIAGHDLTRHFTTLIRRPAEFMQRASMYQLFSYGRCHESTPANVALTNRWVRITTALTKYEAPVCFNLHGLSGYKRMLDIGGNSGEFVLRACRAYPQLSAAVLDLPVVCDIGRQHLLYEEEANRITFIKGDALAGPVPAGYDLISFKSVLHDWPELEARQFLANAVDALEPGGTLLIFERGRFQIGSESVSYATMPHLTFAHCYRNPAF